MSQGTGDDPVVQGGAGIGMAAMGLVEGFLAPRARFSAPRRCFNEAFAASWARYVAASPGARSARLHGVLLLFVLQASTDHKIFLLYVETVLFSPIVYLEYR